jgi:hypothetical protein
MQRGKMFEKIRFVEIVVYIIKRSSSVLDFNGNMMLISLSL